MPLTSKGEKIKGAMEEEYGKEKGEEVFYASKNKGTITGVDEMAVGGGGLDQDPLPAPTTSPAPPTARPLSNTVTGATSPIPASSATMPITDHKIVATTRMLARAAGRRE
jgi:hypothetical protein